MLFLLSPTKTLDTSPLSRAAAAATHIPDASFPSPFDDDTAHLAATVKALSKAKLKGLLAVSDSLAALNYERFQAFAGAASKPAALSYAGPAFKGLDAASLTAEQLRTLHAQTLIVSGLYGFRRGLQPVAPYRLCFNTKLAVPGRAGEGASSNLYEFWGDRLAEHVVDQLSGMSGEKILVNCASDEYSAGVLRGDVLQEVRHRLRRPSAASND